MLLNLNKLNIGSLDLGWAAGMGVFGSWADGRNTHDIEECFRRGLLRRVEPSTAKSTESLMQAGEWLDEAEKNIAAQAYRSA
ncbi:MAG: hypothetical protein Q8P40_05205, partial [Nitrospirota bacterium]|nr:hypothetical protein [Nitrospirota bacterium]